MEVLYMTTPINPSVVTDTVSEEDLNATCEGTEEINFNIPEDEDFPGRRFVKTQALYLFAGTLTYGDFISHRDLAHIIRCAPQSTQYYSCISYCNRHGLLLMQKILSPMSPLGYIVTYPHQYIDVAQSKIARGQRALDGGIQVMEHTPVNRISNRARHDLVGHRSDAGGLRQMFTDVMASIKARILGGLN